MRFTGRLRRTGSVAAAELTRFWRSGRRRWTGAVLVLAIIAPCAARLWADAGHGLGRDAGDTRRHAARLVALFGPDTASDLTTYPTSSVAMTVLFLLILPFATLIAGCDVMADASDTGQPPRSALGTFEVMLGKIAGLWLALSAWALAGHTLLWAASVIALRRTAPTSLDELRLWLPCVAAALPCAALTVAVSAVARRPIRSVALGIAALLGLAVLRAEHVLAPGVARWFLPAANDALLLRRSVATSAGALVSVAVWSLACALLTVGILRARGSWVAGVESPGVGNEEASS